MKPCFRPLAAIAVVAGGVLVAFGQAPGRGADRDRRLREYRDAAFRNEGDAARGRLLFRDEARVACSRCHSTDGSASLAGPDLMAVGDKFSRGELIRSILEPSATIAVGYGTTEVETVAGEEFQGVLKGASAEGVELVGADGRHVRIAAADIKVRRGSPVSLMPEDLFAGLSHAEFTDLVEYLATLRQPESALTSTRGMPAVIPEIARPVSLVPWLREPVLPPNGVAGRQGDVRTALVWFGTLPGVAGSHVAVHQTGRIWRIDGEGERQTRTLFADLAAEVFNERGPNGLLGMAFHPQFAGNRKYYLKHQVFEDGQIVTTVVERLASADLRTDSGTPSRRLWKAVGTTQDHSGGCIGFGPDGFLYIAMGDTGPQQDPQGHGQDLGTPLGKILRIDVDRRDGALPYAVPADNPFVGRAGVLPEIWALGFREPWRFSFDRETGDLWVGDVGQDRVEEVSVVRRGENLGWNVYEGFEPFSPRYRREGAAYVAPVFAYRRRYGNSVTGGHVVRGDPRSSFNGVYVCADYTSRRIFGVRQKDRVLETVRQIGISPQMVASISADPDGTLFVVGHEGMVYRIDFSGSDYAVEKSPAPAP